MDIDEPHKSEEELLITDSPVSDSPQMSGSFRDDDSGRASCCDPDLSDHDQADLHHSSTSSHDGFHPLSRTRSGPPQPQDTTWSNSLYSQVRDVTQRGDVVLSPEEQERMKTCHSETQKDKDNKKRKEIQQLVVIPDERGYTSECVASAISGHHNKPNPLTTDQSQSQEQHGAFREIQNLSTETDTSSQSTACPTLEKPTSPEYTMVDGVDWKNSLFLKPNTPTTPQKAAVKTLPTPEGYLTPDLLNNITPN